LYEGETVDRFNCKLAGPEAQLEKAVEAIKQGFPGFIDTPSTWRMEKVPNVWAAAENCTTSSGLKVLHLLVGR